MSFRGTTNLTNVVQNIRISQNPVKASGRGLVEHTMKVILLPRASE